MAEYIRIANENQLGDVAISIEVLKHIAQIEIEEDKDVRLAQEGLFKTPIHCAIEGNKLKLNINIDVKFKSNVREITNRLQQRIDESITHMTTYDLEEININVVGFIMD